jgi:hypothetical protein
MVPAKVQTHAESCIKEKVHGHLKKEAMTQDSQKKRDERYETFKVQIRIGSPNAVVVCISIVGRS